MAYLVRIMPRPERDLESIFNYIQAESSPAAFTWFNGLAQAIQSLSTLPLRNPLTHENPPLRQLLHGGKPHVYRVIYSVDRKQKQVDVLHIRHHSRSAFQPPL